MSTAVPPVPEAVTRFQPPEAWKGGVPPENWLAERTYEDKKPLPALKCASWELDPQRQAVLLAVYGEICSGWRTLTDVRFKLLGLLPIVSVAVLITLLSASHGADSLLPADRAGIGILGLLFTGAVRLYDLRNNDLYNDLVGRGRQIEAELGVHTGHFRGRPNSRGGIQHDVAVRAVYTLSSLAWLLAALQPWIGGLR
ncbi:MAG: hypothetical protein ACR2G6_01660 [Gemmatimonadaceae bacterium]